MKSIEDMLEFHNIYTNKTLDVLSSESDFKIE